MNIDSIARKDITDTGILFALLMKNLSPEVDKYLQTEEGKRRAVSVLGYALLFDFALAPVRGKSDRTATDKHQSGMKAISSGSVYTARVGKASLQVVVMEGGIQEGKEPIIVRVCPFTPHARMAANYDLVMDRKCVPFKCSGPEMICAWNDFPLLSSALKKYHGRVSVFAHEVLIALLNAHMHEELGDKDVALAPGDVDLGYGLGDPITKTSDRRIRFQHQMIGATEPFIAQVDVLCRSREVQEKPRPVTQPGTILQRLLGIVDQALGTFDLEGGYSAPAYASDLSAQKREDEFWFAKEPVAYRSRISSPSGIKARLSIVDGHLYLVIDRKGDEVRSVGDVTLTKGKAVIQTMERRFTQWRADRVRFHFKIPQPAELEKGVWTLQFTIASVKPRGRKQIRRIHRAKVRVK
jgi:hypothetical protein